MRLIKEECAGSLLLSMAGDGALVRVSFQYKTKNLLQHIMEKRTANVLVGTSLCKALILMSF